MNNILRPTLELTVIIPGMILAYLPVKSTLKISLPKLIAWLFPLLLAFSSSNCTLHFGRYIMLGFTY